MLLLDYVSLLKSLFIIFTHSPSFCRWLVSYGLRLAALKTLEAPSVTGPFGKVVNCAIAHGKTLAVDELCKKKVLETPPSQVPGYDAKTIDHLSEAMEALKVLQLPHIDELERLQDHSIAKIMEGLTLSRHVGAGAEEQHDFHLKPSESQLQLPVFVTPRCTRRPFLLEKEVPLQDALAAHKRKIEKRRREVIYCGSGAARLGSPSVRLPAVLPSDDQLVADIPDGVLPLAKFEARRCDSS